MTAKMTDTERQLLREIRTMARELKEVRTVKDEFEISSRLAAATKELEILRKNRKRRDKADQYASV